MRFSASTAVITIVLTTLSSLTSAQAPGQEPTLSQACNDCLGRSAAAQAPICTNLTSIPLTKDGALVLNNLTKDQAACYCQLTSSDSWIRACTGKDVCGDVTSGADYQKGMADVKAATCPKAGAGANNAMGRAVTVGGLSAIVSVAVVAASVLLL
ncbi:hypothetical protein BGZ88_008780 [Linnemannia elongata]|uniref:Extracellular membrane protein CFEM domain-containing protein n=1 Tax=Linnemannia elongata AG-77 TaxID=1314771 RepID=A0A197K5I6_9FUNG|nr:hypothetical protein BGZ88_008780 [Linnemannia elongata]OAQ32740.1 hypothetical protein K457DRAFT_15814 [Linnemannia elongata AG-77]